MGRYASDIETSGLLEMMKKQLFPKLHNMGFKDMQTGQEILFTAKVTDQSRKLVVGGDCRPISELNDFLAQGHTLEMHNGVLFDGEALMYLGFPGIQACRIIDTLFISWYLDPQRLIHGLDAYGEDYGVPKPKIADWENLSQPEYDYRVLQDCRIQHRLSTNQARELTQLYYGNNLATKETLIDYLMMKANHLRIAQQNPANLNVEECQRLFDLWSSLKADKVVELAKVMPQVPKYELKTKPAKPFKKNGQFSSHGLKWVRFLAERGISDLNHEDIWYTKSMEEGNPGSNVQLKKWLFDLGWEPEILKFVRDKTTGEGRNIPQIYKPKSEGQLCPHIERMAEEIPELKLLQGLGVLTHRVSVVSGFLRDQVDGMITARAQGLTNTLRLKHKELVNMPSVRVWGGKEIRGLIGAGDGFECMGADMSSLEDRVKHHYQWSYDPEYVKLQMAKDYDPHLLTAKSAEMLTEDEERFYKIYAYIHESKPEMAEFVKERGVSPTLQKMLDWPEEKQAAEFKRLAAIRHGGKGTNYASQYGAKPPTIARTAGVSLELAETLYEGYWKLNWSIKAIAENVETKKCGGYSWMLNPVNGLWYWLKAEKDKFSTLCQGTGTWVFDTWVDQVEGICQEKWKRSCPLMGQWHDEGLWRVKQGTRHIWDRVIEVSIARLNNITKMNREFASGPQYGDNYAAVH